MAFEAYLWGKPYSSTISETKLVGKFKVVRYFRYHGLAIDADGFLWATGSNAYGQLGTGGTAASAYPVWVQVGTDKWKDIAGGGYTSVGIRDDGTLWNWGQDPANSAVKRYSPTLLDSGTWSSISCANSGSTPHVLGLRADGSLWAWGDNASGQLGVGDWNNKATPTLVNSGKWIDIACSNGQSIAIKDPGTLWVFGQVMLGGINGFYTYSSTPLQVGADSNWTSCAAALTSYLATKADGTLWTWGAVSSGASDGILGLGDGPWYFSGTWTSSYTYTPMQVSGNGWAKVVATYGNAFGLKADGTLWGWGRDTSVTTTNILGIAAVDLYATTPTLLDDSQGWSDVWAGWTAAVGLRFVADAVPQFWTNFHGQSELQ